MKSAVVAVPGEVVAVTATSRPLGADSVTVSVAVTTPDCPSTTATSAAEIAGGWSSSTMVTTPVPPTIVALSGALSTTVRVSSGSSSTSAAVGTVMAACVWPGGKFSVPMAAVKSPGAAVPATTAYCTLTGSRLAADSVTGTAAAAPSAIDTSPIVMSTGTMSSSTIVPMAWPTPSTAPDGDDSTSLNRSSSSGSVSPSTATTIAAVVSPGANVAVPAAAV